MKKLLISLLLLAFTFGISQTFTQIYQDRANLILQSNINTYLTEFSSYGTKTTGTTANTNALNWLKNKYTSFGYTTSTTATDLKIEEQSWTAAGYTSKNLIVTKKGTLYPNTYVIVCGHYDTIGGRGVNDNGSGIAIILEMARTLINTPTEYSIKFINFSGEEQGLYGSKAYVTNIVNGTTPKMDIRLVFNLDEVGGVAGQTNNRINCEKDGTPNLPQNKYPNYPSTNNAASNTFNDILMNCYNLYNNAEITPVSSYIERSDYMPFDLNNDICIGLYETLESSKPHTTGDTYANMDPVFVYKVGKGALAALQHFAIAPTSGTLGTIDTKNKEAKLSLFPNPVKDYLFLGIDEKVFEISVYDMSGKLILESRNTQMLDVSKLKNGTYILNAKIKQQTITKKFIVRK